MHRRKPDWLLDRAKHAYHVAIRPLWGLVVVIAIGVVLGVYQAAIAIAIPPEKRGPWDIYNLLPRLSWTGNVVFGAAVIVSLILEGSYRRWKAEHDCAVTLSRQLIPCMKLTFSEGDFGVELEEGKPVRQVASVRVTNSGGVQLTDCQVLVRLSSTVDGFVWKSRFPVCAPFYLKDRRRRIDRIFEPLDFDEFRSPIRLQHFDQVNGFWRPFPEPITIPPVDFDALVECISANSQPARDLACSFGAKLISGVFTGAPTMPLTESAPASFGSCASAPCYGGAENVRVVPVVLRHSNSAT